MDFQKLVELYEELEQTSSGNKMRELLSDFFKKVPPGEIGLVTYLTLGRLASEFDDVLLGMAEKSVLKAIALAAGQDLSKIQKMIRETGDAGSVAEKMWQKKPRPLVSTSPLTIHELFEKLHKIASSSGPGSQDLKTNLLASLLSKASAKEAKYVVRIALSQLRMGVGDMTVLDALAIAYTGDKKNKEFLEKAYNICPDVKIIAETLVAKGLKGLEKIDLHVGRPIKMMLAQRVQELEEIPEKMEGKIAVEAKFDGERVQTHKDQKGKITLFSRRLENITHQFPDLVEYLKKYLQPKEFVLEGEIIAVDEKENPLPFQTLMQRRRKYDITEYVKKIPLQLKVFDFLFIDGKSLLHESYEKRWHYLEKSINKNNHLMPADRIITESVEEIDEFFQKMLKKKYEGIIAKSLAGEYQAGTRGWQWIKWKKEYVKEMVDTFDLVIVGAYYGRGRRSGVYGALLCAAYNQKKDSFETVCKVGTGFTDKLLEELPKKLKKYEMNAKPARINCKKEMEPNVWFEPKLVIEILAAEITKSPFHSAELALRFPRFVRFREDKKAEQATTIEEIKEMVREK